MATCCVPWTADYRFDEPLFRRSVAGVALNGTRHIYIFGTAGEGHAVSGRQFREITIAFADEARRLDVEPMVGLICPSLTEVLDRIEWAASIGVRRFQISLPSWGTCTESETFKFFERICTSFPACSFLHYNVRRAGRLLQASEYGRLAEAFQNLVAVKMAGATGEEALAVQRAAPQLRLFLTEKAFAEGCALGVEAGFLVSSASLHWGLAKQFFAAGVAADAQTLARHREEQQGIIVLLREAVAGAAHMDGAFDLMFVKRHLPEFPLRLLPPYAYVSDEAYERFIDSVRQRYPHWLEGSRT
jgi:dihydrodipicolinate synthase/N-acetylneuraminate lyase